MMEDFEVEPIFEDRKYERYQFKLVIDGRKYKGDFHDGEIQWLNPHPKQVVGIEAVEALEAEVLRLLGEHGVSDEMDDLEIEPMLNNQAHNVQLFKLKINGEEFKGTFRDGELEWFHPQPKQKLKDERVKELEEKVHEKMKDHLDE